MDPNACFAQMSEAIEQADHFLKMARERAVALREWLANGGFYPQTDSPEAVRIAISQVLMRTEESKEA